MKKETELWQKLLEVWCVKDGKYGLTIPYLVHAERSFGDRKSFDINLLISEASEASKTYVVSHCGDLEEYIIGLPKTEYTPDSMLKKFGTLALNNNRIEELEDISEVIELLKNLYQDNIIKSLVSKDYDSGLWSDFNNQDKEFIKNIVHDTR